MHLIPRNEKNPNKSWMATANSSPISSQSHLNRAVPSHEAFCKYMKATIIIPLLVGFVLGAGSTYVSMHALRSSPIVAQKNPMQQSSATPKDRVADPVDPFASGGDNSPNTSGSDEPPGFDGYGLILTDPSDFTQRDMCIAAWYASEVSTIENLGRHTGHKFGPVWNRRSPIEILEEELEFMRGFLAVPMRLDQNDKVPQKQTKQKAKIMDANLPFATQPPSNATH